MSNYLLYHVKKTSIRGVILILVALFLIWGKVAFSYNEQSFLGELRIVNLVTYAIFITIAPMMIASLEFSQFMNRRNLDTWFSMPIDRVELFLIHFGNGLMQLLLAYIPVAFVGVIQVQSKFSDSRITGMVGAYVFAAGVFMVLIYGLFVFLFNVANNTRDGILFMFEAIAVPIAVSRIFKAVFGYIPEGFDGMGLFAILYRMTTYYMFKSNDILEMIAQEDSADSAPFLIPETVLWAVICIAALAGSICLFKTRKTQKVSGVSDSWFGYKVAIPLITVGSILASRGGVPSLVFAMVTMFVGYIIYRRGFKFTRYDLISMGVLLALALGVGTFYNM